ncbi:Crp/Fnr family transcriptional regulator [Gloeocapsa sp. PCC 73106]|uniref:Crp/Fnr family transcriptional regulator n=1 Tax=Gloeocapsa sp. PCC 73106 TaxID=102232 RepID=UPI0002AC5E6E|nr:Crp/Fnr family transcriptional regulator [Gloeocapsa sp. PCC 73106]ELR96325.1 cAMP-binding protein [Gloeocapsa sp. PCC 73106]
MLLTYYTSEEEPKEGRSLRFYERGENIPLISSGIWQVYNGVVQLSELHLNGEETLLGWAQPSTFFGRHFTKIEDYQAKALSDVYLKWYLLEEIPKNSHLAQIILEQLIARMKQTEALLAIAGLRRVEERLIALLKLLRQELSEITPEGQRLTVRFTHQNLADSIGTTRVTITRLLGEFQRQGWISFDGDRRLLIAANFPCTS